MAIGLSFSQLCESSAYLSLSNLNSHGSGIFTFQHDMFLLAVGLSPRCGSLHPLPSWKVDISFQEERGG